MKLPADPQEEKNLAFPTRRGLLYYPAEGREIFLLPSKSLANEDCHNSVNEKPIHFELPLSPVDFLFVAVPPNSHLSSIKECSCPLFPGLACSFLLWLVCPKL